ncbi:PaaI family thioesterase [Jiangella rhizosphaerae]|uniref:PaaI family thioesterase n=1 Tax=Jiangella rhizosphaerae TaxID=2293569 RepID=A0A418KP20_9ACTN|nr:PaaI family thioesterase [Jiangella rhizosphaerae]RIQ20994.1 PaaI family thioesterase [Jiangella rhizosphaerae]
MTERADGGAPAVDYDDQATILKQLPRAPLDERMGIEYVEVRPERVVARMPVEGNTQPYGLLHGGASCVLAESVGSVAAMLHGYPDRIAVGVDLNATHHRGVRSGHVTAVATPLHRGGSAATYEIAITGDDGRRVCTARLTCFLRPVPGGAADGAFPGTAPAPTAG